MLQNARILAYKIKEIADVDFVVRPFNRFKPEKTTWWLIPSSEWPAYKYGKIFCELKEKQHPTQKEKLYCGFHVEKGLGEIARKIALSSLIMDSSWLWNDFYEDCQNYKIPSSLLQNKILTVRIAYILEKGQDIKQPEDLDKVKQSSQVVEAMFLCQEEYKLMPLDQKINPRDTYRFNLDKKITHAENFLDLLKNVIKIPDIDWLWVDLFIGSFISIAPEEALLVELWKKELAPWKPWLRKAK